MIGFATPIDTKPHNAFYDRPAVFSLLPPVEGRANITEADLGRPLDFPPASFDLLVSALALDYVRDCVAAFRGFFRVLREGGTLVFSAEQPADAFHVLHPDGNYLDTELVECEWRGFGTPVRVPSYRRPLQDMVGPLLAAGVVLERLLEPRPVPEFERHDPRHYAELSRQPGFICFRARKQAFAQG